jgi:hypothetical protein
MTLEPKRYQLHLTLKNGATRYLFTVQAPSAAEAIAVGAANNAYPIERLKAWGIAQRRTR